MMHLGLLDLDTGGGWVVADAAAEAYDRVRLGEYIREQLIRNGLVGDLLRYLQAGGTLARSGLAAYLQHQFPFIGASERTWSKLGAHLLNWLRLLELVSVEGDTIRLLSVDRAESAQRIGNLRQPRITHRVPPAAFLPGVWWRHIVEVMPLLRSGSGAQLTAKQKGAVLDLQRLGIAGLGGQLTTADERQAVHRIRMALEGEPYRSYWDAVQGGASPVHMLSKIFGVGELAPATIKWRARLLLDWGIKLDITSRPRKSSWRISGEPGSSVQQGTTRRARVTKGRRDFEQITLFDSFGEH